MTNEPMIQIENKSDVWRISSSTVESENGIPWSPDSCETIVT